MFNYLKFRWEVYRLERADRTAYRKNTDALNKARAKKASSDDIQLLEYERATDGWYFQDEIRKLHSRYLCIQAAKLIVPQPDLKDEAMWEKEGPNRIYLTERGINHLLTAIRAERKARAELFLMWAPGVTGLIGAAIGLATILVKK